MPLFSALGRWLLMLVALASASAALAQQPGQSPAQSPGQSPGQSPVQQPAPIQREISDEERDQSGEDAQRLQVEIEGNRVLIDSVLRWVMDLPARGPATDEMAARAEQRLRSFFAETGYDLARVRALAKGGVLYVFVDEGTLDKIFLTGSGSSQTLRFRLELNLPGDVYNSQRIEEELDRLEAKYGIEELRAQLVVLEPHPSTIVQLQDVFEALEESDEELDEVWRVSRGRHALRVHVVSEDWGDGFSYGAGYLLPYGLRPRVGYRSTDFLVDDDRYRFWLSVSGLREKVLTQAQSNLLWAAPPVGSGWLRPQVDLRGRLESFNREHLGVLDYYELEASAVGRFGIEPYENMLLSLGLGYGYQRLLAVDLADDAPEYLGPVTRRYPLGRIDLEWLIATRGFRRDKHHRLDVEFEIFTVDQGMVRRAIIDYQNVWEFGYQDLFWRVRGLTVTGQGARWQDEEPIASPILRAVAGPEEFARNMGQMGLEFRLSLYRDILKASLSGGAAVAGLQERDERDQFIDFFAAGGPGLHVLLLDNFQLDAYYSFGWREGVPLDGRFSFSLSKVF